MRTPTDLKPVWVDTPQAARDVCGAAALHGRVALDTESDSLHVYREKLCLVQLSYGETHAVFDPLALQRDGLAPLTALLADPAVTTVMHGADYDLRVLDRDLGARPHTVEDTQLAAQLLGEPRFGLAALVAQEFAVELDKRHQRSDWAVRPLPPDALAYAAADTAWLVDLAGRFTDRLTALGRIGWWREECARLDGVRWEPPVADPYAFEKVRGASALRDAARDRLAALWRWREETAAAADLPPFRVLAPDTLVALAQDPPADVAALGARRGIGPGTVRRHGQAILRALAAPEPAPPRVPRGRFERDQVIEKRLKVIKAVRDTAASGIGIDPALLAPRAALESVATSLPGDERALETCLARRWRTEVLAPVFGPIVAAWRRGASVDDAAAH